MIRSSCQLIEEKAGGKAIGLLTVTLPTMTRKQLDLATSKWGEIMHRYTEELTRQMERVNLPKDWVFCTEWQQKRGALHAHIAFIASQHQKITSANQYPIRKEWYRDTWQRILKNVLGDDFDCKAATRIERVKHSVGAYMSKYISKGDKPLKDENITSSNENATAYYEASSQEFGINQSSIVDPETGEHKEHIKDKVLVKNFPSSWWGACRELKQDIRREVGLWRRLFQGPLLRHCPKTDEWLEVAERIASKLEVYWQRTVYSAGEIPRAVAGRMKPKSGWKERAKTLFLGVTTSMKCLNISEQY
jgi:hypothetical protein